MMTLDEITKKVLEQIDASGFKQSGAFNLRHNGIALCHGDSEHIKIKKKQDKPGIDIYIDGKTDGEEVHIPVVVDATGMTDVVYNDFYIEEGANVTIVAGCGIHNSGCNESRHDGIHTFHVEKKLQRTLCGETLRRRRRNRDKSPQPGHRSLSWREFRIYT